MLGRDTASCAEIQPLPSVPALSALLECDDTSIALFDSHYLCVYHNAAFAEFYKKTKSELLGHPISDIVGRALFQNTIREQCDQAMRGTNISYESWFQFPVAGYHFCNLNIKPILDSDAKGQYFALYLHDETNSQEYIADLQEMANTDSLTGTYNRRFFVDFGEREFDRAHRYQRPLSMVLFDMNDFKSVNDRFGHAAGDRLLVEACRGVEAALRSSDCFARVGGDEFAIALPEQDHQQALGCALRVRNAIHNSYIIEEGQRIEGSASTGVATLQQGMCTFSYLWKTADFDLYSNKPKPQNHAFLHGKEERQLVG